MSSEPVSADGKVMTDFRISCEMPNGVECTAFIIHPAALSETAMSRSPTPEKLLADAFEIAKRAVRICLVEQADPVRAVARAAEDMRLSETPAHERVLEELSDAGTLPTGRNMVEVFECVVSRLRAAAKRDHRHDG